jgi:hypothetical protein
MTIELSLNRVVHNFSRAGVVVNVQVSSHGVVKNLYGYRIVVYVEIATNIIAGAEIRRCGSKQA